MALLGSITKQPREKIDFDLLYAGVLTGRSDSLASVVTEVAPSGALLVDYAQISGTNVKVKVSNGTTGVSYKVTVLTTTTNGFIYEDEVTVFVEEV